MKVKAVALPLLMSLMGNPLERPAARKASDRGVLKATSPTDRGPPTEWCSVSLQEQEAGGRGQGAGGREKGAESRGQRARSREQVDWQGQAAVRNLA